MTRAPRGFQLRTCAGQGQKVPLSSETGLHFIYKLKICEDKVKKYLRDSFTSDIVEVFRVLSLKENIIVKNPLHHVLHEPRIAVVCQ